ncbi:alpha/beta hydrolase [Pedobacter nyackensis]|uniref:alpha/beta hydrolase n=1 Tax=Pedobacter nyackensis TaxID=475255 RepID=UPI00292FC559|nr:alpha/beta hydrolase fold domain-containing protein [Pedobacter nyackensis]
MNYKTLFLTGLIILSGVTTFSQIKQTFTYSKKDSQILKLDVYSNQDLRIKKPSIIFLFGGGFVKGNRDDSFYQPYFKKLVENNYKVISIDYRLGLKGEKWPTVFNTSVLKNAISYAVTDLYDATVYLIKNAEEIGIDTSMVILSGSSAGAVTILQADWEKRNNTSISEVLPGSFQYKGVIAFAGSILSYKGKPKYETPPAPTMMFHGTDDKVVVYNKIKLFNRGMFGSRYLASYFKKQKYPYYFEFVRNMGHEVAGTPMHDKQDEILWFIHTYIGQKKPFQIEVEFNNLQEKGK